MKALYILTSLLILTSCATQRYGRQTSVSGTERTEYTCKDIKLEKAKANEFLSSVRTQRAETNAAHVAGFLGDFGIGNVMEGDAAILSGEKRLKELNDLAVDKGCKG